MDKSKRKITFMQINAGRGAKIGAEIRNIAELRKIQVVVIQEPYTIKGRVVSFGGSARVISGARKGKTAWAAVVVFDPAIVVMKVQQFSDSHIVCAQLDNSKTTTYLISGYFQYSHPIGTYLERIGRIVRQLSGQKIII